MEKNGIEWAAGLFEGEGSVSIYKIANRSNSYRTIISLRSCDKDVLEKFCSIVGVGKVLGPYQNKNKNRKDWYDWAVQNYRDCLFVLGQLYPFLGSRRKNKVDEFIEISMERWV